MTAFFVMGFEFLPGGVASLKVSQFSLTLVNTPRMKNYIKLFGTYNFFTSRKSKGK